MKIGERFQKILEMTNMKKGAFAKEIGVDPSYISKIISGEKIPSDRVLEDICDKIRIDKKKINIFWLRGDEGDNKMFLELTRNETIAEFVNEIMEEPDDSIKKQFIEMLSNLDARDWETITKMFKLKNGNQ